jgi:flagellar biosynthetic protein FliR
MVSGNLPWADAVQIQSFALIYGRVGALMLFAPFWGGRSVPTLVRVWICVILSIGGLSWIDPMETVASDVSWFLLTFGREVVVGLILGLLSQLTFSGMRVAGQMIEMKCGLGLIQLADPQSGGQSNLFSSLFEILAGMVFFAVNGHYLLVEALRSSYKLIPLTESPALELLVYDVLNVAKTIFEIALRISAPVIVGLCFSDIILGVLSRAIPQMNVFMIAQPIQLVFALALLIMGSSAIVWMLAQGFATGIHLPAR